MYNENQVKKYANEEAVKAYAEKLETTYKKSMERFNDLQNTVESELTHIDKTNMVAETNRNIHLFHRYTTRLAEEKMGLNELKAKKEKMEGELFDFYRNHSDISSSLRSESAISRYVYAHDCYIAINKLFKIQEVLVSYLENITITIRDRGFAVKNVIEVVKIEMGM